MSVNAFTATAISMLDNGDSPEHVREVLGLSKAELAAAVQQAEDLTQNTASPETDDGQTHGPSAPEPDSTEAGHPLSETGIEALLDWGEQHPAKGVQALAAKARTALAELAARRETEQAVADAEDRVIRLERQLARAKAQLKEAKTGKPTADTLPPAADTFPKDAASGNPPACSQPPGGKRSKEELAAIRTWARANGYEVADRGTPAQKVIDAYYADQTVRVGADS